MILASPSRRSNRLLDARMRDSCRPWTKKFREVYAEREADRIAKFNRFEHFLYGVLSMIAFLAKKGL